MPFFRSRAFRRAEKEISNEFRRFVRVGLIDTDAPSAFASGPMSAGSTFMLPHLARC
jgi:hypothetical protein